LIVLTKSTNLKIGILWPQETKFRRRIQDSYKTGGFQFILRIYSIDYTLNFRKYKYKISLPSKNYSGNQFEQKTTPVYKTSFTSLILFLFWKKKVFWCTCNIRKGCYIEQRFRIFRIIKLFFSKKQKLFYGKFLRIKN